MIRLTYHGATDQCSVEILNSENRNLCPSVVSPMEPIISKKNIFSRLNLPQGNIKQERQLGQLSFASLIIME